MPTKKPIKKNIKKYSYKRQGKTVKIKDDFKRTYWTVDLTPAERKALKEGKAKQLFEKKSEKAKRMDRSKTAEKVFDKPVKEWLMATGRSDVKGIDTKETKAEKKEKFQKAKKMHEKRSEKAKETDERIKAKKTFDEPTEEWEKAMNQTDVKGIDAKETKAKKTVKPKPKPKAKPKPKEEKPKRKTVKEEYESIMAKKDYKKIKWENIEELDDGAKVMYSKGDAVMMKANSEKSDFLLFDLENAKKTSLRNESIVAGELYNFKDNPEMTFSKEFVDEALAQLKNPKIYVKEEQPLIIMGDDKTIVIAPLMYEGDIEKERKPVTPKPTKQRSPQKKTKKFEETEKEYFTAIKSKDALVNVIGTRQELHFAKKDVATAIRNKEPEGRIKYLKEIVEKWEDKLEEAKKEEQRINALPRKEMKKQEPKDFTNQLKSKKEEINTLNKTFYKVKGKERLNIKQEIKEKQRELKKIELEEAEHKFLEIANYDLKKAESLKKQYLYFSNEELEDWSNADPLAKYGLIIKESQNL